MKIFKGAELADKELEVLEDGTLRLVENKKQGRYIPPIGERYYYIDHFGNFDNTVNDETADDDWNINHNLVFRTYEECKEYKKFLELLDEYKCKLDWRNKGERKYYLYYDNDNDEIRVDFRYSNRNQGTFYFESEEKAKKFIVKAGEDNVKRYMFDIWE